MTTDTLADDDPARTSCSAAACSSCSRWRLPLMLLLVLAAIAAVRSRSLRERELAIDERAVPLTLSDSAGEESVSLAINFGAADEVRFPSFAWREGATVADLLAAAGFQADAPRLEVLVQGTGPAAFLTEINGLRNQGAGGRNWTYSVNGRRADRSFAVYQLEPGDQVLWNFADGE